MNHDNHPPYRGSMHRTTAELLEWHAHPQEKALDSDLPIVDAHHHLFGEIGGGQQYYLKQAMERDISGGHRVIGTVVVEAYEWGWRKTGPEGLRPVGEVESIVEMTAAPAQTPTPCQFGAGIVPHADLRLGDGVAEVLEALAEAAQGRLRGIRQITAYDEGSVGKFIKHPTRQHLLSDPVFRRGFARLGQMGLSFDVWVYHTQLHEVMELADAFPDTPIILDHVGGVMGVEEYRSQHAEILTRWASDMQSLAGRPNVHVKIGGMGMPVFGFGFEHRQRPATSAELAQSWKPFIETSINAFGPQRCMFESNFPVDKQSCGYTELWNAFKLVTRSMSQDERRDLFYRTACRAYRLPELKQIGDAASIR